MLFVEGFYGLGPVIGILSTGEEWLFTWFPVDFSGTSDLSHVDSQEVKEAKEALSADPMRQMFSPTFLTWHHIKSHSQQTGTVHSINELSDESTESRDDNAEITQEMGRLLCTTEVMNVYHDYLRVLQHLCGAFELMSRAAHSQYISRLPRCLLKFHKGKHAVTFHPASANTVRAMVDFDKFPSKNTNTLVALEDLGQGPTGRAWLCVTVTQPRSAVCVLNFDPEKRNGSSYHLAREKKMWHLIYPEFKSMVDVVVWSGSEALMMPHFATVLESEREQYRDELVSVLTTHFMKIGKVHRDLYWRNIGKYKQENGQNALVVYGLHNVEDYNEDEHHDWIDYAVQELYKEEEKGIQICCQHNS